MTEQEWLACIEPYDALKLIHQTRCSDRKRRLISCSFCRHVCNLLTHQASRNAVERAEDFADGMASKAELNQAYSAAWAVWEVIDDADAQERTLGTMAGWAAAMTAFCRLSEASNPYSAMTAVFEAARIGALHGPDERPVLCRILREILGSPFRPVTFDPAWRTPTVLALARSAYDKRQVPTGTFDNQLLSVPGDALEEASCDNRHMLEHLREQGTVHVRGCWVVDCLLEKS